MYQAITPPSWASWIAS